VDHIGFAGASSRLDVQQMTFQDIVFISTHCYTAIDFSEALVAMTGECTGG
jgi:hypothetical protein